MDTHLDSPRTVHMHGGATSWGPSPTKIRLQAPLPPTVEPSVQACVSAAAAPAAHEAREVSGPFAEQWADDWEWTSPSAFQEEMIAWFIWKEDQKKKGKRGRRKSVASAVNDESKSKSSACAIS